MNRLRISAYSRVYDDQTDVILYSSLSGKIKRVSKEEWIQLNSADIILDQSYLADLIASLSEAKILVPEDFSEEGFIENLRKHFVSETEELSVMIFSSDLCNFRCKYCWENFAGINMQAETIASIKKYLSLEIPKYKRISIKWFGGEPLLNLPAIEEIMQHSMIVCNKCGAILMGSITTNGYLLDVLTVRRLMKCKVYAYQVTLDGIQEEHDRMRMLKNGEGSFAKIVDNLHSIMREIKSSSFRLLVRTNINSDTDVDRYALFYKETFGSDKRFSAYWNAVMDWGGDAVGKMQEKLIRNYDKSIVNKIGAQYGIKMIIERELLNPGGLVCYAAKRNSVVLGTKGQIFKCPQRIYDDFDYLGRLTEDGTTLIDIKKKTSWEGNSETEKCKKCILRPVCLGASCPKRKYTGQECPYSEEQVERLVRVFSKTTM